METSPEFLPQKRHIETSRLISELNAKAGIYPIEREIKDKNFDKAANLLEKRYSVLNKVVEPKGIYGGSDNQLLAIVTGERLAHWEKYGEQEEKDRIGEAQEKLRRYLGDDYRLAQAAYHTARLTYSLNTDRNRLRLIVKPEEACETLASNIGELIRAIDNKQLRVHKWYRQDLWLRDQKLGAYKDQISRGLTNEEVKREIKRDRFEAEEYGEGIYNLWEWELGEKRYRILETLSDNKERRILKAYDEKMERFVVLKVYKKLDGEAKKRLEREARKQIALKESSPQLFTKITEVYDYTEQKVLDILGEETSIPEEKRKQSVIIMEYMEDSLQNRLREGALSLDDVLEILDHVAEAIDLMVERDFFHADIKPANVLFSKKNSNEAKISDFGIASGVIERMGGVYGTPAYLAPEILTGDSPNQPTEVYSLTAMAYELFSGATLFVKTQLKTKEEMYEVLDKLRLGRYKYIPLRERATRGSLVNSLSSQNQKGLDGLFEKILTGKIKDRPTSARELVKKIKEIAQQTS